MFTVLVNLAVMVSLVISGLSLPIVKTTNSASATIENAAVELAPQRIINNDLGIETTAKAVLVIDEKSGKVLFSKNFQTKLPIASLSKLLTAIIFLESNPGWDKKVVMTAQDQRQGGKVYLRPGDEVKVKDLFYLSLVASANEAAAALSRLATTDNFVGRMNDKAQALGMVKTMFYDPVGLNPDNQASAEDLVKLAQAAFSYPEITSAVKTTRYEFTVLNNKRQVVGESTDKLLDSFLNQGNYQIIGAKTGYLDEAGYCLLLKIKRGDSQSLILALLGSASITDRWQEAKGLVDWIFRNYRWSSS